MRTAVQDIGQKVQNMDSALILEKSLSVQFLIQFLMKKIIAIGLTFHLVIN